MSTLPAPVNMVDVARRAGVGMATVSRALSGGPGVAERTRVRVLLAAEELGYVVSPEASRLAGGATRRIAVIVPHLGRWYFAELLEGIESVFRRAEFDVLIYQVDTAAARHQFFEQLPARRKVDAVMVLAMPVDEQERARLESMGVHIVAAGGQIAAYPFVSIDDEDASRQAVAHLLRLGHRRIGMIEAVDDQSPVWHENLRRSRGYHQCLSEAGIEADPELVVRAPWGGEAGAEAMGTLLSLRRPPTAVFAHSDEVAFGALRTIRRAGLRVPEDISVIGIDDHPMAALCDLTTIAQPVKEQGTRAAELLLAILTGGETTHGQTVATRLIPRATTAPPSKRS